ncbi:outer membrane protein assembly factor BamA [Dissulfurispira sp.]|uniref:outer membrane protein assembly factor BamA n=1 Tax=Dissulfurispira sp. TaxID=2817609 RepID=UPI002FDA7364
MEILNSGLSSNRKTGDRRWAIGNFLLVLLLPIACCLLPVVAYAQPFINNPLPITSIKVSGLYSISEDELLYLLDINKGEVLNKTNVREGIKRAFLKGIFEDIIVESLDDANTKITITVKEKNIIDSIKVTGNDYFSDRFIKKQFGIEDGERLNTLNLKRATESLKNGLKKKGFVNSDVTLNIVHKKNNRIAIVINILEGQPEIIKKIIISEPEDIVKSYLRLSEGDIFDRTEIERLAKKVTQYYKEQGYVGTSLVHSYSNGILNIRLDTGKKLAISFNGNTAIQSKILMKEMPFFEVNAFSDNLVEETTARIITLYHQYGYPFAQVAPVISTSNNVVSLEFFIFEGHRYIVDSIAFEGISGDLTIPHESLKDVLTLRSGGYYNPDALRADMETITEFYHALGYLYAEIQEPDIKITDSRVEIKFYIKEGPQVRISSISIKNSKHIKEEDILKEMPLRQGSPYNEVDISDARRKILETYNKRGFLDTVVTVEREISGTAAHITFSIQEGEVTLFGKAIIIGNEQTKYRVINREFLHKENSPLNYNLVLQERHRLYRLGLFTDVEAKLSDKVGDTRDVLYRLKEADAGAVEFGLGYGEYERLRGFFDISYKNLWGMNRQASFRTELSTLERRFILSYYEPWFMEKDLAFKALLLHEDRKEKGIDTGDMRYRIRRDTASAGIEKKLSETVKAELYYDFSVVKTRDIKPDIVLSKEDTGTLITSGIRPGLIYDTRDNPFEPRKGLLAGLSFKVASAALFSETDFVKMLLYVNKYQSLSKRIVLAVSIRGGAAKGFGSTRELPIVERFFLGGRTTVRGYEQDTLGPKGTDGTPTGGNAFAMGNVEFRTDVGRGFGVVAFLDAGNVWKKMEDTDITNLKYTTGLGLRYNTPVGPFRLDYGYKLDREIGESKSEIHFSIGHAF